VTWLDWPALVVEPPDQDAMYRKLTKWLISVTPGEGALLFVSF
jgi:hypothetical protein